MRPGAAYQNWGGGGGHFPKRDSPCVQLLSLHYNRWYSTFITDYCQCLLLATCPDTNLKRGPEHALLDLAQIQSQLQSNLKRSLSSECIMVGQNIYLKLQHQVTINNQP